jgi:hypothetical protein
VELGSCFYGEFGVMLQLLMSRRSILARMVTGTLVAAVASVLSRHRDAMAQGKPAAAVDTRAQAGRPRTHSGHFSRHFS